MIGFDEKNKIFHLRTSQFSYVMQVIDNEYLAHRYFGKKIHQYSPGNKITYLNRSFSGNPKHDDRTFSLDTLPLEFSSNGLGDYRTASIEVRNEDGVTLDLSYQGYRIFNGQPDFKGLPSSHGDQVETLEIDLVDELLDLTVTLQYSVFEEANVLSRSVCVKTGSKAVKLERLLSFILDFPDYNYNIHSLTGRYAYEKDWTITPLPKGKYEVASIRGASSHSKTPFIALADPNITEEKGEIYSAQLVYSGNFTAFAETTPLETTRWGMGLNPDTFSWAMDENDEFQAPEVLLTYTDKGLGEMTHIHHNFVRHHILRGKYVETPRPILINNWEATYFYFTEEKLLELAESAVDVGIELFVLDDGWFGYRDSDNSSLGDWVENREKLPNGLKGLAESINQLGMDFGLWFEPEMVSEDSHLYRQHPEWAIHTSQRGHTYSREQLVLDLSQKEVQDYIIKSVSDVLSSANISYVKWDMNRNITNYPETLANHERFEFHHRYMLGLYRILDELTRAFPNVLFESCAGGGGRNDLGLLCYMPQTWTSDNTDAIGRLSIQEGAGLIFPAITMGAHVSAVPNHQVGRITPLRTRGNVAMQGNLGYELDLTQLNDDAISQIKEQVVRYKGIRDTVQLGDFYRLRKTDNSQAVNYVNKEQTQAVFTFTKVLSRPESPLERVRLRGLNPEYRYYCETLNETFYGDELMNIGLMMPYVQKDFYSIQYTFDKID